MMVIEEIEELVGGYFLERKSRHDSIKPCRGRCKENQPVTTQQIMFDILSKFNYDFDEYYTLLLRGRDINLPVAFK